MRRKHIVLTAVQREELEKFSTTGTRSVRLVNRAKIILALDTSEGREAETHGAIAARIGMGRQTIHNAKEAYLGAGSVAAFLQRKKRPSPPVPPKITGDVEARIIALACSSAPLATPGGHCSCWPTKASNCGI